RVMASQRYEALVTGARVQEKAAAKALLEEAKSGVEQVDSLVKESLVTATLDAEVSRVHVEEGELGAAGFPLVTLVDLNDVWVVFNVKEDLLNRFAKGAVLKGIVPAISPRPFDFKVYFINPRGDYATHRATRQSSGYDLKTFEVRAKPVHKIVGLRPGMSVIVE
ncbi:MAG TPA: secretion protein HylD, partial [Sutterella sp.]|nr:secretion protein HylD [Sutterella sp.]